MITLEYILPTWCLGYLINGDATGLDDDELQTLQDWEKDKGFCVGIREDYPEFRWRNDLTGAQGNDCYTFIFFKDEEPEQEPEDPIYWQDRLIENYLLTNGYWPDEPTDRKEL